MAEIPPGTPISGNFQIRPEILLNGQVVPVKNFSVDINAYSLSSALECVVSTAPARGYATLPFFGQAMQKVRPYPFEIRCGYSRDGSGSPLVLEKGYVDERETEYGNHEIRFTGRGEASLFQDIQVGDPIDRNQGGSKIIKKFFSKYAPHIQLTASESQVYAGNTSDAADPVYATTLRDRTAWDEMQAVAIADAYRLTVHAGKATYGLPTGEPLLSYDWRGDGKNVGMTALRIRHAPRRSHNIKVVIRSYLARGKRPVSRSYPPGSSASESETFRFFYYGLTSAQAQKKAQSVFFDLALREFLCTATIVPDEMLMQTIAQVGSAFSVKLGGAIDPAEQITYGVRQVRLGFSEGSGLPLAATLVMGNLNPIQQGAVLS